MPPPGYVTCQPTNVTTEVPDDIGKDDLNALLYIVVTLLFYSMGIIIGIITYLKREQAEMEEDKMFDMYMQLKREPFNIYKKEKVTQMAMYLKQIEEKQAAREKIENWSVVDPHQLQHPFPHSPSRRQHTHQHSPCPGCSKNFSILEGKYGLDGAAPLAMPENEWADHRGGTTLLCSLTLGVCEPLLTPESGKRVAFPDSPRHSTRSYGGARTDHAASRDGKGETYKSAFRHSLPSVSFSDCGPTFTEGEQAHKELSNETQPPEQKGSDNLAMFDKFDIELKHMGQYNFDEAKGVFQEKSCHPDADTDDCDKPAKVGIQTIPSRNMRTMSLTAPPGRNPKLTRQLSYDPERKSSGLAVHTSGGRTDSPPADGGDDKSPASSENKQERVSPLYELRESSSSNEEQTTESLKTSDKTAVDVNNDMQLPPPPPQQKEYDPLPLAIYQQPSLSPVELKDHHDEPAEDKNNMESQAPTASVEPSLSPPPPRSLPTLRSILSTETPLEQHQTPQTSESSQSAALLQQTELQEQQQQQLLQQHPPVDVRPKVFPVANIPRPLSSDNSPDTWASSSDTTLPENRKRHHSRLYDSWKKGNSQSLDIPRKLDQQDRAKSYEKKPTRTQPERRGALFFTQKSLQHKDLESPKSIGNRRQHRPSGIFTRQESMDSSNSRSSDQSENLESPLLHQVNDPCPPSASSSPSSSTTSPPITSKHQRRIPRLARSQTVDTSKLLQK